ncbi:MULTISPECIES: HAD-IIB family hydrolase [Roseobacteraceae]|jgi:mannosyl-3-phosphoglycerate phosphatase|uniref:Mannosyl-3-phosphoglycerate phosphatase n=1 Tax=Pseudosulfitobacter pseudonitzschiae TaxID=1402135 RepID=A0A221JVV1_9RHOB|nr:MULTISPECIES: HAD-IIB family hydrolase [Roseobacteraceae]ASM70864.1 mannosyl-3-phosphoglycerate phosphatase [Pseudosulfitobacter pseudonitzschiae]
MPQPLPLLLFSDLDGTLISHDTYQWDAARPALSRLRSLGAGVVLASSKTAPEIIALRAQMGLDDWPAIVENGAGLLKAHASETPPDNDYLRLRDALAQLPKVQRAPFEGFGDLTVEQVAKITGLTIADAQNAKMRSFSEPGLWHGSDSKRAAFLNALSQHGITAREGGRFLTLSFGQTKADRMAEIIATCRPQFTVALGDAPNDVEMLQAADYGVIIANPHRAPLPPLKTEAKGRILRTTLSGPEGWNNAVLDLVEQLNI